MKKCLLILSVALLLVSVDAFGQGSPVSAYIGPHLGIQKSKNSDKANYLGGATLRLRLMPALAAETSIAYRQQKYNDGEVTIRDWPVQVTGLLYLLPILYGGLGGGWYNTTFDYAQSLNDTGVKDETTRDFGWHVVAGIELPLSPKTHVYGDVRYVFLNYDLKDVPEAVINGTDANFYSISVGILFGI